MSQGNGATELNTLESLLAEAAAIRPADYIPNKNVPNEHNQIIGDCTQFLKQLETLENRNRTDLDAVTKELTPITTELQGTCANANDFTEVVSYLDMPSVRTKISRQSELLERAARLKIRMVLLQAAVTAEVIRLFPETVGKQVGFDTMGRVFVRCTPQQVAEFAARRTAQVAGTQEVADQEAVGSSPV